MTAFCLCEFLHDLRQPLVCRILEVICLMLHLDPSQSHHLCFYLSVSLSLSGWLEDHAIQSEGMPLSLSLVPLCFSLQTGIIFKVIDDQRKLSKRAGWLKTPLYCYIQYTDVAKMCMCMCMCVFVCDLPVCLTCNWCTYVIVCFSCSMPQVTASAKHALTLPTCLKITG